MCIRQAVSDYLSALLRRNVHTVGCEGKRVKEYTNTNGSMPFTTLFISGLYISAGEKCTYRRFGVKNIPINSLHYLDYTLDVLRQSIYIRCKVTVLLPTNPIPATHAYRTMSPRGAPGPHEGNIPQDARCTLNNPRYAVSLSAYGGAKV